ncbi:MAG TPA: stalk domain-containing protein [Caldisericia bacterium]|nr:stalk domain-containing protein [Caldisericia bacterium]HRV74079.1 stalk domain-containing protein [Caldisericia bacterium]
MNIRTVFVIILVLAIMLSNGIAGMNFAFSHSNNIMIFNYSSFYQQKNEPKTYGVNLIERPIPNTIKDIISSERTLYLDTNYIIFGYQEELYDTEEEIVKYYLVKFDYLNSQELWKIEVKNYFSLVNVLVSPTNVFIVNSGRLSCLDSQNGNEIWVTSEEEYLSEIDQFLIYDDFIFVLSNNELVKIDTQDGTELAKMTIMDNYDEEYDDDWLRMDCDGEYVVVYGHGLFCFTVNNLKKIWNHNEYSVGEYPLQCVYKYSPLLYKSYVIVKYSLYGFRYIDSKTEERMIATRYHTFNLETGKKLYTLGADIATHSMKFIAYDDYLYCPGIGGFKLDTGEKLWDELDFGRDSIENSTCIDGKLITTIDSIRHRFQDKVVIRDIKTGKTLNEIPSILASFPRLLVLENESLVWIGEKIFSIAAKKLTYRLGSQKFEVDSDGFLSMDVKPVLINDRTYLPARFVTEPLGGDVQWEETEKKVICKLATPPDASVEELNYNTVELYIGKPTARVNGVEQQIDPNNSDVVPTIIDGRTMVPMRFLAESLGCEVEWVAETKEIVLTYTK